LEEIIAEVSLLPHPWIDRQTVQRILQVGPRRAQQILAGCLAVQVGNSSVVTQEIFLSYLKQLACGKDGFYEQSRRQRFAQTFAGWRKQRLEQPQVLVEAPNQILTQEFSALPPGIDFGPGVLSIRFETCQEALEKLLALAMAIGRDFTEFERRTSKE